MSYYQRENRVLAYVSAYEASVPTCARISISHNQHIPSFYERALINDAQKPVSELRTFNALTVVRIAD